MWNQIDLILYDIIMAFSLSHQFSLMNMVHSGESAYQHVQWKQVSFSSK